MTFSQRNNKHIPVLAEQVVRYLVTDLNGAYLDLTAGFGGHLKELSRKLKPEAKLYGFDVDKQAIELAEENLKDCKQKLRIVNDSYANLGEQRKQFEDRHFDGILLDLGLSSMQIDIADRGFSFQTDGPLDMRFGKISASRTAAVIINESNEKELVDIFFKYGEERKAKGIAAMIVRERQKRNIETTTQLREIISSVTPAPNRTKTLARIFQALRIAVNDELNSIKEVLPQAVEALKPGGRLVVIAYHSLEDRIVKQFFHDEAAECICPPEFPVCTCKHKASLKILTKKIVTPEPEEIERNSRARSAKMRVAEKVR